MSHERPKQHRPTDLPELAGYDCWIEMAAGYDCIVNPCGDGNHGRHGLEMRWYLRRSETPHVGIVQFVVCTEWLPPGSPGSDNRNSFDGQPLFPLAADLGHHSPKPLYEGEWEADCDLLPGRTTCFYDGSGLNAWPLLDSLLTAGGDSVWLLLHGYYLDTFTTKGEQ